MPTCSRACTHLLNPERSVSFVGHVFRSGTCGIGAPEGNDMAVARQAEMALVALHFNSMAPDGRSRRVQGLFPTPWPRRRVVERLDERRGGLRADIRSDGSGRVQLRNINAAVQARANEEGACGQAGSCQGP